MIAEETKTLLSGLITNLPDLFAQRADSLSEYANVTRNDFLTLVENDLLHLEYLPNVLDTCLSLTTGYLISAATLMADIPGINLRRTLGKLNTNRDPIESILGTGASIYKFVGTESFEHGLPAYEKMGVGGFALESFALEAVPPRRVGTAAKLDTARLEEIEQKLRLNEEKAQREQELHAAGKDKAKREQELHALTLEREKLQREQDAERTRLQKAGLDLNRERFEYEKSKSTASVGMSRDTIATISELSNLSVGKVFDLTFEKDGNKATVAMTSRLAVSNTDSKSMETIISANNIENTFSNRWRRMRSGELSFVKDLLFSHDLMTEARTARMRDKSGFYEHMMRRRNKNFLSGLFSLSPSINNASAVLVFSQQTADNASFVHGGPIDDFKVRQRIFEGCAAILLVCVDPKWETVSIYHRGVDAPTTLSKSDLKRGGKGGNNVEDIVKAYQAGSSPVF